MKIDILALIKARRTIRKYKDKKVPREMIEKVIDAGRWAPSAHNLQPWKFVVIENKDVINKIADLLEKEARNLFSGFNVVMKDTVENLRNAPILLVVYSNGVISKKFDRFGPVYKKIANMYEVQSIAAAIENMLLYSYSLNLGMTWYGMPLFFSKKITKFLKQSGKLSAILSLGYPDEVPAVTRRKELTEITEYVI